MPTDHPYLVPFDGKFRLSKTSTKPPKDALQGDAATEALAETVEKLGKLQRRLHASDNHAVLLVFQAMDAAGKDGTIRAVLTGVDPSGCQVYSFKQPSSEELDHDFLWRTTKRLPERGRIGVFNRSYYEEVLVVRVHPEYLGGQRLPSYDPDTIWEERFESIRDQEKHLARNGTVILKFFLHVSKAEQRRRLLERLDDSDKTWKFDAGDVDERERWDDYQEAYEAALAATSREHAPWYAIPADDKPHMRLVVAQIVVQRLQELGLEYPEVPAEQKKLLARLKKQLEKEKKK